MDNGYCDWLLLRPPILERPGDRSDVRIRGLLSQKTPHFEVWVHAAINTAEEFEDQFLSIDDRGIALLGFQERGCQHGIGRTAELRQRPRWHTNEFSQSPSVPTPPGNRIQKGITKRVFADHLVQNPCTIFPFQTSHHRL